MKYNAIQSKKYNAMQWKNAMQKNAMKFNTIQYNSQTFKELPGNLSHETTNFIKV